MKKAVLVSLLIPAFALSGVASADSNGPFRNDVFLGQIVHGKPGYGDSASCMGSTMSMERGKGVTGPSSNQTRDKDGKQLLSQTNYGQVVLGTDSTSWTGGDHSGQP